MFDLGPVESIDQLIVDWRKFYGLGASATAGQQLKQAIWTPLEESLADVEVVLVSPDGALGSFPFAALPGAEPESYLLEDRQLVTVPVPQLLPELMGGKIRQELPKELLVMGGVDYDNRAAADAQTESEGTARPSRPWEHRMADAVAMRSITGQGKLPYLEATDGEAIFIKELYETSMKLPPGSDHIGAAARLQRHRGRVSPPCPTVLYDAPGDPRFLCSPSSTSARGGRDSLAPRWS